MFANGNTTREITGQATRLVRAGPWIVAGSLLVPQVAGSAVNIAYNLLLIRPLMTPAQSDAFVRTTTAYNLAVYPAALAAWAILVSGVARTHGRLLRGEPVDGRGLLASRRRAINLPWWGAGLGGLGWVVCIPVFLWALRRAPGPLDARLYAHLPFSFLISAMIALTHGFFAVEIASHRLLFPVLFREVPPSSVPRTLPLTLGGRGLFMWVSSGLCPAASLLLLVFVARDAPGQHFAVFAFSVAAVGASFGLVTALLVGVLVTEPVRALRRAALSVATGDLSARVGLRRADEFGPLIDEFNRMVAELREKARLQESFGAHVGRETARRILSRDPGLGGVEEEVTVLFTDIRGFTTRCEASTPAQVVELLNMFFTGMVEVVERDHGGMVNKFLGDGFMALFGSWCPSGAPADSAVAAGRDMLERLRTINEALRQRGEPPLRIGIGIHTGRAILGSLGSASRMEYTAIGDAVNVASRIESLTRPLGEDLLFSSATRAALKRPIEVVTFPPQTVKGRAEPIVVCGFVPGSVR